MKHPSSEEWMDYLYSEMPGPAAGSIRQHVSACPACREQHDRLQTAKRQLGAWQLAPAAVATAPISFPIKWALAALLVLGIGFGVGRVSAPRATLEAIRAQIEPALKASLSIDLKQQMQEELRSDWQAALGGDPGALNTPFRRQLRSSFDQWSVRTLAASRADSQGLLLQFAQSCQANREQDQQAMLTLWRQADRQYQAEQVSLRRAVETVALVAADKFQRTESQLGQLASYTEAKFNLESPDESLKPLTTKP